MACSEKAKQLTLLESLGYHSKKLKLAEAEDDSEQSHSDVEVEDESLDEQDLSGAVRRTLKLIPRPH